MFLWRLHDGKKYPYTEALALRKDMVTYDPALKAKNLPPAKSIKVPPDFEEGLKSCQTRSQVIRYVEDQLDVKMERRPGETTAAMKKEAKMIYRGQLQKRQAAEKAEAKIIAEQDEAEAGAAIEIPAEPEPKPKARPKARPKAKPEKLEEG